MLKYDNEPIFTHLEVVDSTNNYVANLVRNNSDLKTTIVSSDYQTEGRGQRATKWQSLKSQNALFSIYLTWTDLHVNDQFLISMQVALSIACALTKELGEVVQIKWPNDLYIRNAKIGGILIESDLHGSRVNSSIIGIGINVNQMHFELPNCTSLMLESGRIHDRHQLIRQISMQIIQDFKQFESFEKVKDAYTNKLWGLNETRPFEIIAIGEILTMKILGVSRNGKLLLKDTGDRLHSFDVKELKWIY